MVWSVCHVPCTDRCHVKFAPKEKSAPSDAASSQITFDSLVVMRCILQTLVSIITAFVIGVIFLELDMTIEGIQNRSVFDFTVA